MVEVQLQIDFVFLLPGIFLLRPASDSLWKPHVELRYAVQPDTANTHWKKKGNRG